MSNQFLELLFFNDLEDELLFLGKCCVIIHNSMNWDILLLKTEHSVFMVSKHESYCHIARSDFQL